MNTALASGLTSEKVKPSGASACRKAIQGERLGSAYYARLRLGSGYYASTQKNTLDICEPCAIKACMQERPSTMISVSTEYHFSSPLTHVLVQAHHHTA